MQMASVTQVTVGEDPRLEPSTCLGSQFFHSGLDLGSVGAELTQFGEPFKKYIM